MIDETFHLTPLDVRRYEFGNALRGYDPRARQPVPRPGRRGAGAAGARQPGARGEGAGFHEQLRAFRERDKAINDALVSAQQLRGEIREQAEKEAQLIIREARAEAERHARRGARRSAPDARTELAALDRSRRAYLAQLRAMIERQLAEVTAAEQSPTSRRAGVARRRRGRAPPAPEWLDSLAQGMSARRRAD